MEKLWKVLVIFALCGIAISEARSALDLQRSLKDGETEVTCTLDAFFLRVKQSTCTCECDGTSVPPTAFTPPATPPATPRPTIGQDPTTTVDPTLPTAQPVTCSFNSETPPVIPGDDQDRVDCWTTGWVWNIETLCREKGCIWSPSTNPDGSSTGLPWCHYPLATSTGTGLKATSCLITDNVARYQLTNTRSTQAYSRPWGGVVFQVEQLGNHILRVKFHDSTASRYEVPVPLTRPRDGAAHPDYEVQVFNEPSFYFKVVRRSTGAVLFDTSLGGFVLEDQFLQIKTRLPTERIYGFGENRHRTFKRSLSAGAVPMWAKDEPPSYENGNHYGFHPYYMVVENDTKAHGVLLLNSNGMEHRFAPGPTLTLKNIGGILDFYFILGDNAEDVTQKYTGLIGRSFLPPYWALGFQLSRWGYNSIGKLRQIINRNRAAGIPQDVQTLDIDYMRHRQNFVYDWEQFNGLEGYVEELKRGGIRTVIILDPAIHADAATKHPADPPYRPYTRGVEQDVYIKWAPNDVGQMDAINIGANGSLLGKVWPDGRAAFPDFFTRKARTWWIDEVRRQYQTLKFDGLWIDMNEPASFGTNTDGQGQWFCTSGDLPGHHDCMGLKCPVNSLERPPYIGRINSLSDKTICASALQECRPGQSCNHYDVHNLYGWSQSEPTHRANQLATGSRPFVISRSTYPGSGQYVGHWLGDNGASWGDLQYSIVGMLDFNIFGIPYIGADICGFFNEPSEELCARWQQVGAFYPYSRNHNGNHFRDQDPAEWPVVADVTKKALNIRYRLLPYLYTLFYHAHVAGNTVVRPVHHEFATEAVTYDISDQFLWGDGLLIAPVLHQGHTTRNVYFPDAVWYNYNGQKLAHRKQSVSIPMPLDEIGVYYRGGRIIPAQGTGLNTLESRRKPLQFIVALDDNQAASGDIYWDDGESIDPVQRGNYLTASTRFFLHSDQRSAGFTVLMDAGQVATLSTSNGVTIVKFDTPLQRAFTMRLYWR
ncbi:putative maltase-glucoamylase 2 [Hypsibius exemplaris]|uniref:alpha-glucosidase n=1 Tax=Hypsibius exemplaris TaxID=2072580 RepID=A0A9X6NDN9_HYPEX|nr:putative maltase-glucoamylase 2 [Hypsibius exemplaris]